MKTAIFALNLASGIAALVAAYFWFRSAWGDVPPMRPYWGEAPKSDPFVMSLAASALSNRIAAAAAFVSAMCAASATLLGLRL